MFNTRDPVERRRIVRFLAVGVGNTAFGYAVFALLITLGLDSAWALLGATAIGIVFNFYTTGRLVFTNRNTNLLPRFVLAYGVTYFFNLILLKTLEMLSHHPLFSQLICLPPTTALSYLLLRHFVFGRSSP